MVTLGISKNTVGEYTIYWKDGTKFDENKRGFETYLEDAQDTLLAKYHRNLKMGIPTRVAESKYTRNLNLEPLNIRRSRYQDRESSLGTAVGTGIGLGVGLGLAHNILVQEV